jgi:mono/diheme cytochrome c family protein
VFRSRKTLIPALPALLLFCVAISASAESTAGDEKAGAVLFRDKGCAFCHGIGGVGTKKAPSLADLRKNKEWTPKKITGQIMNGGQKMPPFEDSLTDQEIAQLVAYLRAKKRPIAPPAPTPPPAPAATPAPPPTTPPGE